MSFQSNLFCGKIIARLVDISLLKSVFTCYYLLFILFSCGNEPPVVDEFVNTLPLEEWRKAGATKPDLKTQVIEVSPGVDLNTVIEESQGEGISIIKLNPGEYRISSPIQMKDRVYLEGVNRDSVWIISDFKRPFQPSPFDTPCSIEFQDLEWSGISKLTLRYQAVAFDPFEQQAFHEMWGKKVFKNDPNGDTLLYVGHIGIKRSKQVIVDNCKVLNAGTDPIVLADAHHISILNTHVKSAYNKGGKGNGYFNIDANSSYVLVKNNKVEKIRHLAIQNGAHHNVVVDNNLEVDVNFHNGDAGYNLVEGNIIRIPEWHGWHCFSVGVKSKHGPPGPHNYLFNNLTQYKQYIPKVRPGITEYGDSIVYTSMELIDTIMIKNQPMFRYQLGDVDRERSVKSNRLFVMNHEWDEKDRVFFVKKLEQKILYPTKITASH